MKGLGPARKKVLEDAGIHTLRDLLFTLPVSYKDTLHPMPIAEIASGQNVCVTGYIKGTPKLARFSGRTLVTAQLTDGTGTVTLQYFNQPWMKDNLTSDREYLLYGRADEYRGRLVLSSPSIEKERALIAQYRPLPGIPGKTFAKLIEQALIKLDECVRETLPAAVRARNGLCEINYALREAHRPQTPETLAIARRRMTFETLLLYQTAMSLLRGGKQEGVSIEIPPDGEDAFWRSLPFSPTQAQRRVLHEIAADLAAPSAMSRMVQGDVGCGKTALAFGAIALTAQGGYQAALMAPTEILARQHLESARKLLTPLGLRSGLLIGGMKAAERREALAAIQNGDWQVVIGTHALISEGVRYHRLGLIVTDEQHRFGVRQRRALADKADQEPNALVMSATPIPRSLALVLYGDLDLSVIDEMPPGRTPVTTRIVPEEKREGLYRFIHEEAAKGRQTYIVCPLVEENESLGVPSAQETYAELTNGPLRDLRLGLTYGSQSADEKERVITAFSQGKLDVLVSTTVIEVGVNVPSATVMVIESADRFGLSQLHQLRGRVGRGAEQSWCFLMARPNERLTSLCRTNDGFEIAREDLKQRGPGELMGTRQHGAPLLPNQKEGFDIELIEQSRSELRLLKTPGHEEDYAAVCAAARAAYQRALENVVFN
ncbi:MAG: ATP-dependent DNA helicase RecG [Clostridia bacterium]|nr:ATP-dependent DNA helicase RecG [Clostridia bacterium]